MRVDPLADRPLYRQLADLVRAQMAAGEVAPGQRLRAPSDDAEEHHVCLDTVERAMAVLHGEGLIVTDRLGNRVRRPSAATIVPLGRGEVYARMPTEPERKEHGINEGVPVLVVKRAGQSEEIYPADQVQIVCGVD
jgi:DNA-binding transcriptional regulator YhcF (GntR family)